jgi:hypothetical protein
MISLSVQITETVTKLCSPVFIGSSFGFDTTLVLIADTFTNETTYMVTENMLSAKAYTGGKCYNPGSLGSGTLNPASIWMQNRVASILGIEGIDYDRMFAPQIIVNNNVYFNIESGTRPDKVQGSDLFVPLRHSFNSCFDVHSCECKFHVGQVPVAINSTLDQFGDTRRSLFIDQGCWIAGK